MRWTPDQGADFGGRRPRTGTWRTLLRLRTTSRQTEPVALRTGEPRAPAATPGARPVTPSKDIERLIAINGRPARSRDGAAPGPPVSFENNRRPTRSRRPYEVATRSKRGISRTGSRTKLWETAAAGGLPRPHGGRRPAPSASADRGRGDPRRKDSYRRAPRTSSARRATRFARQMIKALWERSRPPKQGHEMRGRPPPMRRPRAISTDVPPRTAPPYAAADKLTRCAAQGRLRLGGHERRAGKESAEELAKVEERDRGRRRGADVMDEDRGPAVSRRQPRPPLADVETREAAPGEAREHGKGSSSHPGASPRSERMRWQAGKGQRSRSKPAGKDGAALGAEKDGEGVAAEGVCEAPNTLRRSMTKSGTRLWPGARGSYEEAHSPARRRSPAVARR